MRRLDTRFSAQVSVSEGSSTGERRLGGVSVGDDGVRTPERKPRDPLSSAPDLLFAEGFDLCTLISSVVENPAFRLEDGPIFIGNEGTEGAHAGAPGMRLFAVGVPGVRGLPRRRPSLGSTSRQAPHPFARTSSFMEPNPVGVRFLRSLIPAFPRLSVFR